jgi:hypothetical protein
MNDQQTVPKWYMVVASIALVWNLMGIMAFAGTMMMSPEMLAAMPLKERELYESTPVWVNIVFALSVFGGALGCILLLLKKSLALPVLIVSLISVLLQMFNAFFLTDSIEVFGPGGMIMPIMIIIIAIALVWLANNAKSRQWIS